MMNDDPDRILEKERNYLEQMASIRKCVFEFGEEVGLRPMSRGRRAHASLHGKVGRNQAVLDIDMDFPSWDRVPVKLPDDYAFSLFASATRSEPRLFSRSILYWQCRFDELPKYTHRFLQSAWSFFKSLDDVEFTDAWPGPANSPDLPPNFGGPRPYQQP